MRNFNMLAASSMLSLGLMATPASAAELIIDSGWETFSFGDVGSAWSAEFTFDLPDTAELRVTDAFFSGDQFEVFINSVSQGLTSFPTTVGDQIGSDYDTAFSDPRWSSGSFILGPGSYTVSGIANASPFAGGGGAAIQLLSVTAPVPEPGTWAMLLVGFAFAGGAVRAAKRRQQITVSYA